METSLSGFSPDQLRGRLQFLEVLGISGVEVKRQLTNKLPHLWSLLDPEHSLESCASFFYNLGASPRVRFISTRLPQFPE
jgi:hypothetical protein